MSLLQCGTYACGTSIRPVFYFDIQRAGTLGWNHLAACMGVTPRCVLQQSQPVRWRMSKVRKDSVSFKGNADESLGEGKGLSRRSLLKKTAGAVVGAAAAGLTGAISARAQVPTPNPLLPFCQLPPKSMGREDPSPPRRDISKLGNR